MMINHESSNRPIFNINIFLSQSFDPNILSQIKTNIHVVPDESFQNNFYHQTIPNAMNIFIPHIIPSSTNTPYSFDQFNTIKNSNFMENNNLKKKTHVKNKFTASEDQKLIDIVKNYEFTKKNCKITSTFIPSIKKTKGSNDDWSNIAKQLNTGRNARQCRDRWLYYLSPQIQKEPWTADEDELLIKKYNEFGPKWTKISSFFHSRTDVNLKNHWKVLQRKYIKAANELRKKENVIGFK